MAFYEFTYAWALTLQINMFAYVILLKLRRNLDYEELRKQRKIILSKNKWILDDTDGDLKYKRNNFKIRLSTRRNNFN